MKRTSIPMMRKARVLLATLLGLATFASAQQTSAPPTYQVELVIFRHLTTTETPEHWELEAAEGERLSIPDEEPSPFGATAEPQAPPAASFPALSPAQFKLTAIEEALRRSRDYRPLAHIGWTQPGYARHEAKSLSIGSLAPVAAGLTGEIALTRGRYLHLTLDLAFAPDDEPGRRFVLRQTRRMRSNERHYIDHPKFGVIAVVTPEES